MQSLFYGQTQASNHVTVLHRHSLAEVDGEDSTPAEPKIVTEHFFVISPDLKHDHLSVHHCSQLVAKYLNEIWYPVTMMHEWTDRCSAQYKSRHCMGDVSYSVADFGFPTIRNYFDFKPPPEAILELLACNCTGKCIYPNCICIANGVKFTDMRRLAECYNQASLQEIQSTHNEQSSQ